MSSSAMLIRRSFQVFERLSLRPGAAALSSTGGYPTPDRRLAFLSSKSGDSGRQPAEWRKQQLDALENKFQQGDEDEASIANLIQDDEDLQPMWKAMESRVKNRRSLTVAQASGKTGRANIRKTDEDVWLQEGLYGDEEEGDNSQRKS
ncbi:expressed unknown protein [Seminavis robusta]|uniref:Uncharacterized protein n=1 Tax=Seminavis robusta TaxID=568900 RepID=A0A9N8H3W2_9STRA|nr:expressed unknown protein [Seminavis robusta]|eukprot:Sro35_g022280.1 n/a (148) ;mRNA; r:63602-64045